MVGTIEAPRLRKGRLVVVILLTFITGGLYIPLWFLRRRAALNALESSSKLGVVGPALLGVGYPAFVVAAVWNPMLAESLFGDLFRLALGIGLIALSFKVRHILLDHFEARIRRELPGSSSLQTLTDIAGIWTFLLQIWYLQHKINQYQRELYSPFVS